VQDAKEEDADHRREGEQSVAPPDSDDPADRGCIDESGHGDEDDRSEGRLGEIIEDGGEEEERQQREDGRRRARELRPGAALGVDGGLRQPAACGVRLEEPAREVGGAERA
jgi:hypothetical protein